MGLKYINIGINQLFKLIVEIPTGNITLMPIFTEPIPEDAKIHHWFCDYHNDSFTIVIESKKWTSLKPPISLLLNWGEIDPRIKNLSNKVIDTLKSIVGSGKLSIENIKFLELIKRPSDEVPNWVEGIVSELLNNSSNKIDYLKKINQSIETNKSIETKCCMCKEKIITYNVDDFECPKCHVRLSYLVNLMETIKKL